MPAYELGAQVVVSLGGLGSPSEPRHQAAVVAVSSLWGMPMYYINPPHPGCGPVAICGAWLLPAADWPAP